jgi:hypothetical protein
MAGGNGAAGGAGNASSNISAPLSGDEERLLEVVSKGDVWAAQEVVKKGANVNCKNKAGNTPLLIAAFKGFSELVDVLLFNKVRFLLYCTTASAAQVHVVARGFLPAGGCAMCNEACGTYGASRPHVLVDKVSNVCLAVRSHWVVLNGTGAPRSAL